MSYFKLSNSALSSQKVLSEPLASQTQVNV